MAAPNRSSLLTKAHKVLKKHYQPVPTPNRGALEHLLFACCLENAPYDVAERAFAALSTPDLLFHDWNEVRVSTVKELTEALKALPEAGTAAGHLKRVLQSIFEAEYSFDLEFLRKKSLGDASARLKKIDGITPFAVAYLTQVMLGGHAIPVDRGTLEVFVVLGILAAGEGKDGTVPGLERAIPKQKGAEFSSLLHQFCAEFSANPCAPAVQKILLEISPEAKARLPKRPSKATKAEPAPAPVAPTPAKPPKTAPGKSLEPPTVSVKEGAKESGKDSGKSRKPPSEPPKKTPTAKALASRALEKKKVAAPVARRKPR